MTRDRLAEDRTGQKQMRAHRLGDAHMHLQSFRRRDARDRFAAQTENDFAGCAGGRSQPLGARCHLAVQSQQA